MTGRPDTRREAWSPLQTAAALSAGLHLLALLLLDAPALQTNVGGRHALEPIDLAKIETATVGDEGVFAMEGLSAEDQAAHRIARARREAYLGYLDRVSEAVHRHRLDSGDTSLIGLVLFSFDINAAGRFENIVLRRSSGNDRLDQTARNAVIAASGEVKRPPILGDETLTVFQEIRFQYGLR